MKFRIHFVVDDIEDSFTVTGDTLQEVKHNAQFELEARGLDRKKNEVWSIEEKE
jgi:hypothetical protein